MELSTFSFFLFFCFICMAYWVVPPKFRVWILLLASYYFYFSWRPYFAVSIFIATLVSYGGGLALERWSAWRRSILGLTLVCIVGQLFVFKYLDFFLEVVSGPTVQFELLLPIGISFYTFQVVGYLLDVYSKKIKPEQNIVVYSLFVSFFPKLIAGPIERATSLLPQLHALPGFQYERVVSGLQLFTWGLFKKLVVADNLRVVVDRVFTTLPEYKGLSLVLAVFFFSWTIYADFSGYTDMARGIARVLGISLLENFRAPYFASSLGDFWRRWHMSLSSWLRDYLYIPLGGSRKGAVRTILNTLIIFVVCGLWHGAAVTFIVWGLWHGVVVSLERMVKTLVGQRIRLPLMFGIFYTQLILGVSWVFFRAKDLSDAWYVLRNAPVGIRHFISPEYVAATLSRLFVTNRIEMGIVGGSLLLLICAEVLSLYIPLGRLVKRLPIVARFALYTALIFTIVVFRSVEIKEFVYVQF
jgi:alginate O-acetyltransferase complex protein AlgI